MHIILVTPAAPNSKAGNRTTAARWASIFRELGHRVTMVTRYEGQSADVMVALHAWRSADSIQQYSRRYPDRPLIVAMTGTDAYQFIKSDPQTTLHSIRLASYLVGLHDHISNELPLDQRHKVQVIYQSAEPAGRREPYKRYFHVAVMGHLRFEKDSLRPALAARLLPPESRIQVHHYGKAHTDEWAEAAKIEMRDNARYTWHGEVAHHRVRRVYQRTNLMVLPSRMEGGANVISEAVMAGVPILASDIKGSTGLLGENYPGYYPVEDEEALSRLLLRVEFDSRFYQRLQKACMARRSRFTLRGETSAWHDLLNRL